MRRFTTAIKLKSPKDVSTVYIHRKVMEGGTADTYQAQNEITCACMPISIRLHGWKLQHCTMHDIYYPVCAGKVVLDL